MGHFDGNGELTTATLVDDTWKEAATKLAALLFGDATENPFADIQRVVIVPDGVLWYVPFELLPLNAKPLIESYSFRYSPTVSLSLGDGRNQRPLNRTAIMDGPFHLRDDEPARTARIAEFKKFVPDAETLATPLPGAGVHVAGMADRLVVLQDMVQTGNGGYGWSILPKTAGSTLGDWMRLPWGQCEVVCLPGFKTGAESGLKRHASGNDLFLTTCGLMASGSRTVVLSRWRTGGASTYVMMGEFLEKAQTQGAEQAWRSAVNKVRAGESAAGTEPRIRDEGQPTKTSHPFFWSGYMMVDISARSGNAVPVDQLQVAPNAAVKPDANVPQKPQKPQKNIKLGNP
jgi:CHAT domain-containing protein